MQRPLVSPEVQYIQRVLGATATQDAVDEKSHRSPPDAVVEHRHPGMTRGGSPPFVVSMPSVARR